MRSLIERHGARATIAPSMREVPLEQNAAVFEFTEALFAGRIDIVIFMTGVGARTLLEAVETKYERTAFFQSLEKCTTIVRGPKPTAVLRDWDVRIDHKAPEPNTWRELLTMMDSQVSTTGKTVAVQEYGQPNPAFYDELRQRDAAVMRVPVYRWELPDDTKALVEAIHTTISDGFDVLMFTSANQLNNVLRVAESLDLRDQWITAANKCVIASIGPTSSETLRAAGLPIDFEPAHPKMGHLVREALQSGVKLLSQKRH